MSDTVVQRRLPPDRVRISLLGYDDIATVRYIHAACYRLIAMQILTEQHISAFVERVMSSEYTDRLAEAVRQETLLGARLDGELVATAGWLKRPGGARLEALFVRPMLGRLGIGSLLLARVEQDASAAGFAELALSSPLDVTAFFEQHGYGAVSSGASAPTGAMQIPVTFMRKVLPPLARATVH